MMAIPTEREMLEEFVGPIIDHLGMSRAMKALEASKPVSDALQQIFLTVKASEDLVLMDDVFTVIESICALYRKTDEAVSHETPISGIGE
jgi:hypothetical protein